MAQAQGGGHVTDYGQHVNDCAERVHARGGHDHYLETTFLMMASVLIMLVGMLLITMSLRIMMVGMLHDRNVGDDVAPDHDMHYHNYGWHAHTCGRHNTVIAFIMMVSFIIVV